MAAAVAALVADKRPFPRTLSFWKCSNEDQVARRDMIVGFGYCQIAYMKKRDPKAIFLLTPGLFPGDGNEYGGMSVTYGTGLWFWRQGYSWKDGGCDKLPGPVDLGCIRQFIFDYDQMYNADGSVALTATTAGPRGWNLPDPLNKGTRDLVARFMAYTAKVSGLYAKGWDGIFSDNWIYGVLGESWAYGSKLDTDRDGKVDNYSVLRKAWDDGLNEVGTRIRTFLPGKIIAGNGSWYPMKYGYYGTDPQGWLKASNATMVENLDDHFYNNPAAAIRIGSRWLRFPDPQGLPRYVLFQQNARTGSGSKLEIPATEDPNKRKYMLDPGVMRSMRWGFTLALMAGAYYEIIIDDRHGTLWWYDEFDGGKGIRHRGYLGQPLGSPYRLRSGGVWRRNFKHGIAINNSTGNSVTLNLGKPFRHLRGPQDPRLNNGSVVTTVTIPGHDGVILVNTRSRRARD